MSETTTRQEIAISAEVGAWATRDLRDLGGGEIAARGTAGKRTGRR